MEYCISISMLNDFIFCPYSVYFHNLYSTHDTLLYHDTPQTEGKLAHSSTDNKSRTANRSVYMGMEVFSEEYGLFGKIDVYDARSQTLTERKKHIKTIYDGYVFQLYAQYFALTEMGYLVGKMYLYCMTKNKKFPIALPESNPVMLEKFRNLIGKIQTFDLMNTPVKRNKNKCEKCIYRNICDLSLC